MGEKPRTVEGQILDKRPAIREAVRQSSAFAEWLGGLKKIAIDGEVLYIRGGDMLRDEDQVMFEWARGAGLLSDEEITSARLERAHQSE